MIDDYFYRAFEASFRGTREEIRSRLKIYLPFVAPFIQDGSRPKAIDLGCGRGEWLELMREIDVEGFGVDLDEGMLTESRSRGLAVENDEALACLRGFPDGSVDIVSAFHVVEHLKFETLRTLIAESLRVLRPGGLLIMETPNAENINVGTLTFHMDPTHVRPIPPGLLSFLPRHAGYSRAKVLRLQENADLRESTNVRLIDVFQGVSPDYAVIAQKKAEAATLAKFDEAFSADPGLTLETLSDRFEQKLALRNETAAALQRLCNDLRDNVQQLRQELGDVTGNYQRRIDELQSSTSWRITAPIRILGRQLCAWRDAEKRFHDHFRSAAISIAKRTLRCLVRYRALRRIGSRLLSAFPELEQRIRCMILGASPSRYSYLSPRTRKDELTPRAQRVLKHLSRE